MKNLLINVQKTPLLVLYKLSTGSYRYSVDIFIKQDSLSSVTKSPKQVPHLTDHLEYLKKIT